MQTKQNKLLIILAITAAIEFVVASIIIILITNGIRIDRQVKKEQDGLVITEYEQVYHVFFKQEIFLSVENTTDKMIGTLTIRDKNSGKEDTIHKLRPNDKRKLYFAMDNYFKSVDFEIVELKFVEMY